MRNIIKKWDIILIVFFLFLAGILLLAGAFKKKGAYVVVDTGSECQSYSLYKDQEITIENPKNHAINQIHICDGMVSMTYADCPDLICVHHKPIDRNGEVIICVPNGVSLRVVSDLDNDIDN